MADVSTMCQSASGSHLVTGEADLLVVTSVEVGSPVRTQDGFLISLADVIMMYYHTQLFHMFTFVVVLCEYSKFSNTYHHQFLT